MSTDRPTRRDVLLGAAALGASACAPMPHATTTDAPLESTPGSQGRRPRALFLSHGAPDLALDMDRGADLERLGRELAQPSALVVISAHWERTPLTIGTRTQRPLYHDYGGFDPRLRDVTYDAAVARRTADLLERRLAERLPMGAVARDDERPWDHGVWVPLVHLLPGRDVPVLQVSLASALPPDELLELGRVLRDALPPDVLIVGSGGFVHNLRALDWTESSPAPAWATDFDAWGRDVLARGDRDALIQFEERAPALRRSHPTLEHWLPVLVTAGAAERASGFPVGGFEYGSLGRTAVEFG